MESCRIIPGNSSLTDTVSGKLAISKESDTEHDMATSQEDNKDQAKTNKQEEGNVLYSQVPLRRTHSGPASTVCLRQVSTLMRCPL